jgi:ABC-type Mn2+/Zn2+ transport system permease subunit
MNQFVTIGCAVGTMSALAGFCVAYQWDLPVGPTDVALLGVLYFLTALGKACWRLARPRSVI